ncbi:MAG: SapC family protein [Magnetococcales bacterium]|nr:SapC family protein [Magnetococcales bacterium]
MKQLLFYDRPAALHRERHRAWKIDNTGEHFSFARQTNSVVVTGMEFVHLAKEYPIVFAQVGERIVPLVLLGLRTHENLFVDEAGRWNARYIPAFVRRYPFVLADAGEGNWTVHIDEGFAGFNTRTGLSLFDEAGVQTPMLERAIRFLKEYQEQSQRTELFVNRLQKLALLSGLTAQIERTDGEKIVMGGLLAVEEKKLLALDPEDSMALLRAGELGWIYAHLLSLANLGRLSEMVGKTGPLLPPTATEAPERDLMAPQEAPVAEKAVPARPTRKTRKKR